MDAYVPEVLVEDRKVRYLRLCVDLSLSMILRGEVSRDEAESITGRIRNMALSFFPDKGETFDMIYAPRFRRAIDEAYGSAEPSRSQESR